MTGIKKIAEQLAQGSLTSQALVSEALQKIKATSELNAYLDVFSDSALKRAKIVDEKRSRGEALGPLAGIPIAVKDNIVMDEGKSTAGSKILAKFESPYNATVVERLLAAGAIPVGKTNLDEFAMGSTTESSFFGPSKNPLNPEHIPGGSSGGSAVAVASDTVRVSLGSDTGGSIRQPAACCGVLGLKPTYGRVSRYGLIAFASSLDQIGPFARCSEDAALLLQCISGFDEMDNTSSTRPVPDFSAELQKGIKGKIIGLPKEYFGTGLDAKIAISIEKAVKQLEGQGAKIQEISLPHMEYGVAAYYVIACAEASANLARFDGVRYTHRSQSANDLISLYSKSRAEGFGTEVKRRIILGTYVLSSGFYDAYYLQAQKVRRVITDDFNKALSNCDIIATPTAPAFPQKLGDLLSDPITMYLQDIYTVAVNLAGLPALSMPLEKVGDFHAGLQFIGKPFQEAEILQAAYCLEAR